MRFQCARRWFDEGQTSHLINLGKYVSAMLAAGAKVVYEKERSVGWLCLVVVVSSGATVYQLYWDFVKDWGLLQMNSKNPWLRNELMLRRKFIYYFSMVYIYIYIYITTNHILTNNRLIHFHDRGKLVNPTSHFWIKRFTNWFWLKINWGFSYYQDNYEHIRHW